MSFFLEVFLQAVVLSIIVKVTYFHTRMPINGTADSVYFVWKNQFNSRL